MRGVIPIPKMAFKRFISGEQSRSCALVLAFLVIGVVLLLQLFDQPHDAWPFHSTRRRQNDLGQAIIVTKTYILSTIEV